MQPKLKLWYTICANFISIYPQGGRKIQYVKHLAQYLALNMYQKIEAAARAQGFSKAVAQLNKVRVLLPRAWAGSHGHLGKYKHLPGQRDSKQVQGPAEAAGQATWLESRQRSPGSRCPACNSSLLHQDKKDKDLFPGKACSFPYVIKLYN